MNMFMKSGRVRGGASATATAALSQVSRPLTATQASAPPQAISMISEQQGDTFAEQQPELNAGVRHQFSRIPVFAQAKLLVSSPGDPYEQEAERVAEQVVYKIGSGSQEAVPPVRANTFMAFQPAISGPGGLQRCGDGKHGGETVATQGLEASIRMARGHGRSLPRPLRTQMGRAFGTDFTPVNIHADAHSDQLNRAVQARAFTVGHDIFFRQGAYDPGTRGGQQLLAHELTHVMQQRRGAFPLQKKDEAGEHTCSCQAQEEPAGDTLSVARAATAGDLLVQRDACYIPKKNSPYSKLPQTGAVGPGENFDKNQRFAILAANFQGGVKKYVLNHDIELQKSDESDDILIDPKSIKGDLAEVDHIVPYALGGCNDRYNAQVLSGTENVVKGDTYPYGKYSKSRIYDPATNTIFNTLKDAKNGGADLTTLSKSYPNLP